MKKIVLLIASFIIVLTLSACSESLCVGPECIQELGGGSANVDGTVVDNAIPYTHINGEGSETDKLAFILLEYKLRDYVKYQITFLACTCRPAENNYWNVAYVEINTFTNDIRTISFGEDSAGHYTPGAWGDSSGAPEQNGVTLQNFEDEFIPWLVGKSYADFDGITLFLNGEYHSLPGNTVEITDMTSDGSELLVDAFAGSSVSSNNMLRVIKELLKYHEENYTE